MLVVAVPEAAGPWWRRDRYDRSEHRGAGVDPADRRSRRPAPPRTHTRAGTGRPMTEGDDDGIPGRHGDHGDGWHHGRGGGRDPDQGGGTGPGAGRARAPAVALAPAAGRPTLGDP